MRGCLQSCHLQCRHRARVVPSSLLMEGPRARQARLFAEAGITKIRLTGGEPTLRQDIVPLTGALAALPGVRDVGITTNALALRRKLADLQAAGARGQRQRRRQASGSTLLVIDVIESGILDSGMPIATICLTFSVRSLLCRFRPRKDGLPDHGLWSLHVITSATAPANRAQPDQRQPGHAAGGPLRAHDASARPRAHSRNHPAGSRPWLRPRQGWLSAAH